MIIPIRCFTCGKVIADKYDYYIKHVAQLTQETMAEETKKSAAKTDGKGAPPETKHFEPVKTGPIMDKLGLTRYCCRRHMLTTVDMMDVI